MFALHIENEQAQPLDPNTLAQSNTSGLVWLHLEGKMDSAREWLDQHLQIDAATASALCDEFTRPRLFVNVRDEVVLTARACHTNAENNNQMVSLRALVTEHMVLTLSYVDIPAVSLTHEKLIQKAKGIKRPSHVLERLCDVISQHMTAHISELDESLTDLEDNWETQHQLNADALHSIRLETSRVRRYLTPQLEAFVRLNAVLEERLSQKLEKQAHTAKWRELVNSIRRDIEVVTEIRERVTILRDALQHQTNEKTNRIMYSLSLVSAFFLPLTFIASMLGMNVSGIPLAQKPWAFAAVCSLMLLLTVSQWWIFKRLRWLK